ncbi:hypothetical protein VOLCADRAFT_92949 [Volvox carteri f. nagariensis]|uniref:Protein SYS1 homolog n=1 Tax=Volvox carteri f. nagariensis TaxID=3068 RepID=D8U0W0_VOLCA|nr:uncharacterized protein VOLCADRAFT_92949 [Volvox carteri f. nagariensis]EFJ46786.1 hypothetical protein VOLCADRAFT_92949 [Volvox carteri f. nagariensis]|eukprot:XP_002952315.1 hypothetical protein VOLCADRAFT_92949 [Volvox carteri f. nagariensis]
MCAHLQATARDAARAASAQWSIILVGALHVDWHQLGRYPFRTRRSEFSPRRRDDALGSWLAMMLTYTCCVGLTYGVVGATRKSWDYVVSSSLLHLLLCIIINQAFPVNWIWWLTILLASIILSVVSEVVNYYLRDMREIALPSLESSS